MVFIEKLHTSRDVEANKHYIRYFSEDEWFKEIGEENDNGIESDSHQRKILHILIMNHIIVS